MRTNFESWDMQFDWWTGLGNGVGNVGTNNGVGNNPGTTGNGNFNVGDGNGSNNGGSFNGNNNVGSGNGSNNGNGVVVPATTDTKDATNVSSGSGDQGLDTSGWTWMGWEGSDNDADATPKMTAPADFVEEPDADEFDFADTNGQNNTSTNNGQNNTGSNNGNGNTGSNNGNNNGGNNNGNFNVGDNNGNNNGNDNNGNFFVGDDNGNGNSDDAANTWDNDFGSWQTFLPDWGDFFA